MLLENEHILLRAVEPEDLELLYQWENNPEYWHAGETRVPYSKFTLKQYILSADKDIFQSKQIRFMIESKVEQKTVGTIDLFDFDIFNSRMAVGVLIDKPYQESGYATQSLRLAEEYVFDYLKINQLYAHVAKKNQPSRKLFEKNGFIKTGILKQWIRDNKDFTDIITYQLLNKK